MKLLLHVGVLHHARLVLFFLKTAEFPKLYVPFLLKVQGLPNFYLVFGRKLNVKGFETVQKLRFL